MISTRLPICTRCTLGSAIGHLRNLDTRLEVTSVHLLESLVTLIRGPEPRVCCRINERRRQHIQRHTDAICRHQSIPIHKALYSPTNRFQHLTSPLSANSFIMSQEVSHFQRELHDALLNMRKVEHRWEGCRKIVVK